MKNVKISKIFRFDEDDIYSFACKYGKSILPIFFTKCLEKAIDKNGFDFVESIIFGDDFSSDKNYKEV